MLRFLAANWLWLVLIVGMFAMHRGHGGGCGGHSRSHDASAGYDRTKPVGTDQHADEGVASERPGAMSGASHHRGG